MVLSYRHGFHAGNVGDVVKHSTLALLLTALASRKPKPFLFIDTHAAAGQYHLQQHQPSEHHSGIARLWTLPHTPPSLFPYLHAVRSLNGFSPILPPPSTPHSKPFVSSAPPTPALPPPVSDDACTLFSLPHSTPQYPPSAYSPSSLTRYPGSPALFLHLRRPHDRMLAYELHNTERATLSAYLTSSAAAGGGSYPLYPKAEATGQDGVGGVRACKLMDGSGWGSWAVLPQPERRGLVFVDPPYEVEAEYDEVVGLVRRAVRRWATATYAVWYPLLAGKEQLAERMLQQLQSTRIPKMLHVRFSLRSFLAHQLPTSSSSNREPSAPGSASSDSTSFPPPASRIRVRMPRRVSLYGCGLVLINPPQLLPELLSSSLLPFLATQLASSEAPAHYAVDWLNAESAGGLRAETASGGKGRSSDTQPVQA